MNRDGCDLLVHSSSLAIITSFKRFVSHDLIHESSGKYLIYLLECMQNFTNYDGGIEPLLGKNFVECLNGLLVDTSDVIKLGAYRNWI